MEYTDRIYGTFAIDEPVIGDLIASAPIQRLRRVNQYGASFYRFPHLTTTRFEHSVGVYYILKKLGAPVLEQIVGLLHDAPHTAFSHVTDVVFGDASAAFHERFHEKILIESEIPKILSRHGFSVWALLDKKSFRLAERDLPDLCADRIDYFFRDCVIDKQLDLVDARRMLEDLLVVGDDIVFHSYEYAKQFTITYRAANEKLWANPLQSALYYLLASAMKLALEEGVITFEDLFTTDQEVYRKMQHSGNERILKYLHDMEHVSIKEDAEDFDYHVRPKIRVVDPFVLTPTGKIRLSELDSDVKKQNEEFLRRTRNGYFVKIIE